MYSVENVDPRRGARSKSFEGYRIRQSFHFLNVWILELLRATAYWHHTYNKIITALVNGQLFFF